MRYMKRILKRILIITSIGITILILFIINSCASQTVIGGCIPSFTYDLKVDVLELNYNLTSDSIIIRGEIFDSLTLEPLIGANVLINSPDLIPIPMTGTGSDIEGKFKLSFKYDPDYLIKFSYIGYNSQTYSLKHFLQQYFEDQSGK